MNIILGRVIYFYDLAILLRRLFFFFIYCKKNQVQLIEMKIVREFGNDNSSEEAFKCCPRAKKSFRSFEAHKSEWRQRIFRLWHI